MRRIYRDSYYTKRGYVRRQRCYTYKGKKKCRFTWQRKWYYKYKRVCKKSSKGKKRCRY